MWVLDYYISHGDLGVKGIVQPDHLRNWHQLVVSSTTTMSRHITLTLPLEAGITSEIWEKRVAGGGGNTRAKDNTDRGSPSTQNAPPPLLLPLLLTP